MSKIITMMGLLSVMLSAVAQATDCCKTQGPCCKPDAPCCKK